MQHRPIPDTVSHRGIGSIQDRLHLASGEMAYKASIRFLRRNGQNALNLFQIQFGGSNLQTLAGVSEQKFERVRVGITSVRARPPLNWQAFLQKGRDMRGDQGHGRPPAKKASHEWAMPLISSGVASRYQ